VRWHWALFPLLSAGAAGVVTVVLSGGGGNRWCNASSFSCSVDTNMLGVVLVGGLTSYWYYGFRRALLLARHRRAVLARLGRAGPAEGAAAGFEAREAVVAAVLARYRDWRSQPPVTVVAGPAGSGKSVFLAEVVRRLAGSHSWYVPVPLDDVAGGGEQDILDAAQRQLDVILHDASVNPGLIESLARSLTRSRRLMLVIDDVDRIGPALSAYERALVVARLMSSAQQLDVPLLATAQSGSVESIAGTVIELPPPSAAFITGRLDRAQGLAGEARRLVAPALTGPLATPSMADRVITLIRRDGDRLADALRRGGGEVVDLVVWRHLLEACEVPGAALTAGGLELVAYVLLITGQREIRIGAGPEWQHALRLAGEAGVVLPSHHAGLDEITAYADGGFLDAASSPVMLQFPSPQVQAILAGQFVAREPSRAGGLVPQLGTSASARQAVAAALRLGQAAGSARVHACLLSSLNADAPLTAAAHAAGLSLAIRYPPPGWDSSEMDELAGRLALVLADRVTAANGPALGVAGLRDAVQALAAADRPGREEHLLTALHSSSFQVRLSVALALIRRGTWELIARRAGTWISEAESPERTGVQHQLGLALWFCPHLAAVDPSGRGDELYARGLRLAAREDHNPLMFEISLARGFKLAAWARPDLAVDERAVSLLGSRPRFWYSRVCLVHAIGIRLASAAGRAAMVAAGSLAEAEQAVAAVAAGDPHPLVREAARITAGGLANGREAAAFCWLAESDMGRSNYQLGDEAMRLLGDVSLLLNLIYCAEPWSDHEWRLLGSTSALPACIARPAHRQQYMTGGCPADCPAGLCPYPGPSRRPRGRGELSAAFCQAQHDVAERLGPAPWHEGRSAQPQVDFWLYAEQGLANRDGWEINL
jgi:AAA ATPase domain